MISLSIFNNPYSFGNPFVLDTLMTESSDATDSVVDTASTITSGTRLSKFKY